MDIKHFNTADELINIFKIDEETYTNPVIFSNRKVGFSIQRNYPSNIRYKPPKNTNNQDDTVALIHVFYTHPSETRKSFDSTKVPLIIRIVPHSRYLSNHFDYNFKDPDCPTEESVNKSKSTPKPIALDYLDEFFFNHEENAFLDNRNNQISGSELLDRVFKEHFNTVHLWKGLRIRSGIKAKSVIIATVSLFINLFPWILKKLFGRTIEEENISLSSVFEGYKRADLKKLSTDSLNIFGYKASRSVIITFCLIVFVCYLFQFYFHLDLRYFKSIFSNNFLSITHAILVLWLLDVAIPNTLFRIMNALIRLRKKLFYMGL